MKLNANLLLSLLLLVGGHSALSGAEEQVSLKIPPVVSTDWLAERYQDNGVIVLHIGPKDSYEQGHIPGARAASLRRIIRVNDAGIRDEMVPVEDIEEAFSELGIDYNSRIVIYFSDENSAWAVARYLLTLEYVGMSGRVAYLDGGLPKWTAEGHPVSTDDTPVKTSDFKVTTSSDIIVDTDWLSSRLQKQGVAIVDGRPEEGYSGLAGHWDRLGHIPGAGSIPFFTLLAEDQPYMLKSRDELSKMFQKAGASPGDTVVVYCGTGLWASLPYLAARYLDYEVRLYDASFQEWSSIKSLPVAMQDKNKN